MALNLDTDGAFRSSQFPADGVVGLGFGQLADLTTDSFFGTLIKQGGIVDGNPVFGLSLAESGSELVIGGTDTSRLSGSLTYVNLDNPVSALRGVPCLGLTRPRYRVYGRSRSILYQSTETSSQSALRKYFSTRPALLSLVTQSLSLIFMPISPVRPGFQTAANG